MVKTRKNSICKLLREQKIVYTSQLAELYDVSTATIRRDLSELEAAHIVERSYGCARLICEDVIESSFTTRELQNLDAKQKIARNVLPFLEQYDSFYLDGSSTCVELSKLLPDHKQYTVFTNSNACLQILKNLKHVNVFVIGGHLAEDQNTFDGDLAIKTAKELFVDVSVISCSGFSSEGYVNNVVFGSHIRQVMLQNSACRILLADNSKYKKRGMFSLGTWEDIDMFFTDVPLDPFDTNIIQQKNVKIIY